MRSVENKGIDKKVYRYFASTAAFFFVCNIKGSTTSITLFVTIFVFVYVRLRVAGNERVFRSALTDLQIENQ